MNDAINARTLLPCPFCGETNIFLTQPDKKAGFKGAINCPACLATMPREVDDDAELIECWNTRASTPKATVEREAIARERMDESAEFEKAWAKRPWTTTRTDKERAFYWWNERAILARLDEAAIRADQRERDAKIADDHTPEKFEGTLAAHVTGRTIASAIRGGKQP